MQDNKEGIRQLAKSSEFFKQFDEFKPNEWLMRHKRNLLWSSAILALWFLGDIEIEKMSGVFFSGKIGNPSLIKILLFFAQLYFLGIYYTLLSREYERYYFEKRNKQGFFSAMAIARLQELLVKNSRLLKKSRDGISQLYGFGISKQAITVGETTTIGFKLNYADSDTKEKLKPWLDVGKSRSDYGEFNYTITSYHDEYFEENKKALRHTTIHEFMEYYLPLIVGVILPIATIIYSLLKD